jgi:hypothetical protein
MKIMLITFFDIKGIVQFEFILQDQTVNQAYMWKSLSGYMKLCIEEGLNFGLMFRFSTKTNAATHKALSFKKFLAQKLITEMEHPLSSPDLALNDF